MQLSCHFCSQMIFAEHREIACCETYSLASAECTVIRFSTYLFREFIEGDNISLQEIQQMCFVCNHWVQWYASPTCMTACVSVCEASTYLVFIQTRVNGLKLMVLIFIFLSTVVIFFILVSAARFRQGYAHLRIGLLLILAGTIGNLIDRIRLGYVIDFIDLRVWPVFNIADLTITFGGALLVYHIIRKVKA